MDLLFLMGLVVGGLPLLAILTVKREWFAVTLAILTTISVGLSARTWYLKEICGSGDSCIAWDMGAIVVAATTLTNLVAGLLRYFHIRNQPRPANDESEDTK